MAKHKISISISTNYEDVYKFLKNKPNISNFVCEVIREKMNDTGRDINLDKKIEEVVNRLLNEKNISISNNTSFPTLSETLTCDDMDLIKNLF